MAIRGGMLFVPEQERVGIGLPLSRRGNVQKTEPAGIRDNLREERLDNYPDHVDSPCLQLAKIDGPFGVKRGGSKIGGPGLTGGYGARRKAEVG